MRDERYHSVAITLHWLIAALVVTNVILGFGHEYVDRATSREMMWWHKSIGISVFLLTLVRLGWRISHPIPPLPIDMAPWKKFLARANHWAFYFLLLALPFLGWLLTSASPRNNPIPFFGLQWPFLPFVHDLPMDQRKALTPQFAEAHETVAKITLALVVLHVAAALHHIFVRKDEVGHHMLPFLRSPGRTKPIDTELR
jgi:cytochrome b561